MDQRDSKIKKKKEGSNILSDIFHISFCFLGDRERWYAKEMKSLLITRTLRMNRNNIPYVSLLARRFEYRVLRKFHLSVDILI